MQMPYDQFWDSEYKEIYLAIKGWSKRQEEQTQTMLYQNRILAFYMYRTAYKVERPSDLYLLPWEVDKNKVKVSPEEFKRITKAWDKSMMGPDGKFR